MILSVNPGEAFSDYITRIPNGNHIVHPCDTDMKWYGVGHQEPGGAGALNVFGQDFERYGKIWNKALCNRDSDGDGRTNGQELGDPHCEWTPGLAPRHTAGISHPGE
ncbi:hypothetical protein KUTeg_017782 [Tegillarca granosa]|uniref:Temptin Cys/Cys disulfide domain-containing protein n=1 Tax=Tegillarca granosa TaxID=220873 RepID=A0ABQ9EHI3_TEGGR|nr:hypothetical protein KUTeg_017782 [Tegillarca granosa]